MFYIKISANFISIDSLNYFLLKQIFIILKYGLTAVAPWCKTSLQYLA